MTPSMSSPPARGVALLGWSLSGPNTLLNATCIFGVGSTPSKIRNPYVSNRSLSCARTPGSLKSSWVTAPTRAPNESSSRTGRTVIEAMVCSCSACERGVGPLDELRYQQWPADEERPDLLDRRSTFVPLIVAPWRLHQLGTGQTGCERHRSATGVRHVGRAAAEDQDGDTEALDVVVVESRHERVVARAVREHPSVHHVEELLAVHGEDASSVAR